MPCVPVKSRYTDHFEFNYQCDRTGCDWHLVTQGKQSGILIGNAAKEKQFSESSLVEGAWKKKGGVGKGVYLAF